MMGQKLTDNQWFNMICGMHSGLKLKEIGGIGIESNTVLRPIGIGGYATIGLAMPTLIYDGINKQGKIPVIVHDVNIGYSGFSIKIDWDSTRLRMTGVSRGDFGTIGGLSDSTDIRFSYTNGTLKARGMRGVNVEFTEQMVLFYINVEILGEVTDNNPINIRFDNTSNTDLNYTSLLLWFEQDGQFYNGYITPLTNIDGAIVSEIPEPNKEAVGGEVEIAAKGSSSGVYVGTSYTTPGSKGVVPIVSNSNVSDSFPYNKVRCVVAVEDKDVIFEYIRVVGVGGFSVSTVQRIDSNGYLELDITASRLDRLSDSVTFCYIEYKIADSTMEYTIPLNNKLSEIM